MTVIDPSIANFFIQFVSLLVGLGIYRHIFSSFKYSPDHDYEEDEYLDIRLPASQEPQPWTYAQIRNACPRDPITGRFCKSWRVDN